jgi:hypothetical protein
MLESREWAEWHLTPGGWVRGTCRNEGGTQVLPAPPDRVKTCVFHLDASVPGVAEATALLLDKVVHDPARARELEARFGPCPQEV